MSVGTGIVLIDKPAGLTSFQTLWPVKKALEIRKVGHAGTLDRFATGLLVLFAGSYTRLVPFFSGCDKTYRATARFGTETDTLDPEGVIVKTAEIPSREKIEAILPQFTGSILQRPPAYSAIHIDGKRAYERVLAGENPEMKERPVVIHLLLMESYENGDAVFMIKCTSGTYIRSLARDIAGALGSCAHLVKLERLSIGPFTVESAVPPDRFSPTRDLLGFTPEMAASVGIPALRIEQGAAGRFLNGAALSTEIFSPFSDRVHDGLPCIAAPPSGISAVFTPASDFLGIVEFADARMRYLFVMEKAS